MSDYHRMSIGEKQAYARSSMREPSVVCPRCEVSMPPVDLIAHMEARCEGRRDPHPASKWIDWKDALKIAGSKGTLGTWIKRGDVRFDGPKQERKYLLRDVVKMAACRRKFDIANRAKKG